MATHLAVFVGEAINHILTGDKSVDIRLSRSATLPYRKIMSGDEIYLKQSSGAVMAKVEVENVLYFHHLTPEKIAQIAQKYGEQINMPIAFWDSKQKSQYATLIFLSNPQRLLSTINYHKNDRRSWVVLQ
ncbi:MAG: hypothetical protein WC773_00065 [Patescibacteria group bacterium]|jgi:hypothetical protein